MFQFMNTFFRRFKGLDFASVKRLLNNDPPSVNTPVNIVNCDSQVIIIAQPASLYAVEPGMAWEKGRVDIDYPLVVLVKDDRAEQSHITGQHQKPRFELFEGGDYFPFDILRVFSFIRQIYCWYSLLPGVNEGPGCLSIAHQYCNFMTAVSAQVFVNCLKIASPA